MPMSKELEARIPEVGAAAGAASAAVNIEDNPLLSDERLPPFDRIRSEHVAPAVRQVLGRLEVEVQRLEEPGAPDWAHTVEPLERITDRLHRTWGTVLHLMAVSNSEELRRSHEAVQGEVVGFSVRLRQSQALYEKLAAMKAGPGWSDLAEAARRIVDHLLLEAELGGVALAESPRARIGEIQAELARASTRFSNNVLDATKAYALLVEDPADIEGMPETAVELASQSAAAAGHESTVESGPWRFTLDLPSVRPLLEHCPSRELRERIYRAWITRAASGEQDNAPLIEQILRLRAEEAELLGYPTYAELSLATKMAPSVEAVEGLLEELREASAETAAAELGALGEHARACGSDHAGELAHWDIAFWAERLREERYSLSDEELRPYFPFDRVLEGLFALAGRLFDVTITAADTEAATWHEDVRYFRVADETGRTIADFFLDPYSRPGEKRGGAWIQDAIGRSRLFAAPGEDARLPSAYLVCNQTPPVGGKPSLMTFDEVRTLFHEFGHSLQHMLTRVDYGMASGIEGVEWDAVEVASQFMENWCYDRRTLSGLAAHWETGEPLPEQLFDKLLAARTYRAGSQTLRQVHFALTDLELHHRYRSGGEETAFDVDARVARRTAVLPRLPEDRTLCSFAHIFAGGYAAGYYSYKWAEVLSADVFSAFEEAGLDDAEAVTETGRRFRETFLADGGGRHPMDVFRDFRGREPLTDALLRHSGLAK